MKILCIGHASYDITCPVDEYPVENTKYRLMDKVSAGGGPASNAAFLLGKWGIDTLIMLGVINMSKKYGIIEIGSNNTKTHIYENSKVLYDKTTTIEKNKNLQPKMDVLYFNTERWIKKGG